jgi:hypothetical protein
VAQTGAGLQRVIRHYGWNKVLEFGDHPRPPH